MIYFVVSIICLIIFLIYLLDLKKTKFDMKLIVLISVFTAISYVLNMIKFIRMPQGGSITFFSMLPVMVISFIYGRGAGITSGILLGILKMLDGIVFVHPLQFILDYILANMLLGFSSVFGIDGKFKMCLGCLFAGFMSLMFNVLSGVMFFSEFVGDGMNVFLYSFIYNFLSVGVEVILTTIVMMIIPMKRIIRISKNRKA